VRLASRQDRLYSWPSRANVACGGRSFKNVLHVNFYGPHFDLEFAGENGFILLVRRNPPAKLSIGLDPGLPIKNIFDPSRVNRARTWCGTTARSI
jgi:hypothetical protein